MPNKGTTLVSAVSALALAAIAVAAACANLPARMERLVAHALARQGLSFYADFDDSVPVNAVTRLPILCVKAPRVSTPSGHGRQIPGDHGRAMLMSADTAMPAQCRAATVSLSIAPADTDSLQEIFNFGGSRSGVAAFVGDNRVSATLRSGAGVVELAAPWPAGPGELVNVALSVGEKEAVLFLDGEEASRASLPEPVSLMPRRMVFPCSARHPFSGVVDAAAVWTRALSVDEARSLCRPGRDLCRRRAFLPWCLLQAARAVDGAVSGAMRVIDRLSPFRGRPAVMHGDCPILAIHTTASDDRHFMRAHEKSLFNGYRTGNAETLRRLDVFFDGQSATVEVGLDDIYGRGFPCRRPAFVLRGDIPGLLGSCGAARLYPPEAHALIHPDASDVLPLDARYVRLYEGKSFKGIYAVEPFDAPGSAWMARGEAHNALFIEKSPKPSDLPPRGVSPKEARRRAAAVALSDNLFPWSGVELAMRRRRHGKWRRHSDFRDFANPVAPVGAILGENRAPFFVTENLNLAAAGPGVSWSSSDPAIVSASGVVSRPDGDGHRVVTLTATDGATGARQEYRLRVMARKRTLPTMFISIGGLPSKYHRMDFMATFVPEDGSEQTTLCGLAGAGGGLRHRGNTSFVKGVKRSMSLKFDGDFAWPDPAHPSRRLILHSGYSDPTRLRNKIAFESFNAAFGGEFPVTRFAHCEVFVNGEWMGVWEASRHVRDVLPADTCLYKVRGTNTSIWNDDDTSMLDCETPPAGVSDPYAPIRDAFAFVAGASDGDFASSAAERFHMDNLVGFFLILRFSGNQDGVFMNQYFARLPGDGRFLVVPWDYDKSFLIPTVSSNNLLRRLMSSYPGFGELMRAKWRGLREWDLSDASVFGLIDAESRRLAPYMDEEWRLLKPAGCDVDFAESVRILKDGVRRNLDAMDASFPADNHP